jgi:hypothetical protein
MMPWCCTASYSSVRERLASKGDDFTACKREEIQLGLYFGRRVGYAKICIDFASLAHAQLQYLEQATTIDFPIISICHRTQ